MSQQPRAQIEDILHLTSRIQQEILQAFAAGRQTGRSSERIIFEATIQPSPIVDGITIDPAVLGSIQAPMKEETINLKEITLPAEFMMRNRSAVVITREEMINGSLNFVGIRKEGSGATNWWEPNGSLGGNGGYFHAWDLIHQINVPPKNFGLEPRPRAIAVL